MKVGRGQLGVGLVEVLIALTVFAVGIMGTVTMQLAAIRSNFEAAQYSTATNMARDILARMRSNQSAIALYAVEEAGVRALPMGVDCRLESCTSEQLAAFDLSQWTSLLRGASETFSVDGGVHQTGGLVLPRACIRNNAGQVSVTITWRGINKITSEEGLSCGVFPGMDGVEEDQRSSLVMTSYIGRL